MCGCLDAIALLDGHEDDEVQGLKGGANPGKPLLQLERIGVLVSQEVSQEIEGAAIEQNVSRALLVLEQLHRAAKLFEEVLQARWRNELVPLLFEQVVRLVD